MSQKKTDRASEEIKDELIEELETEDLDEVHRGGLRPRAGVFTTIQGRSDLFNSVGSAFDGETIFGGIGDFNDLPLKRR